MQTVQGFGNETESLEMRAHPQHTTPSASDPTGTSTDAATQANFDKELEQEYAGAPSRNKDGGEWRSAPAGKGKERADGAKAGPSTEPSQEQAGAAASGTEQVGTVRPEVMATIGKAVTDLIPHQQETITRAHQTLADQRKLLQGVLDKGQPTEYAVQGPSWSDRLGQLVGRAPARRPDEEASTALLRQEAPEHLQQNALGAQAIIDHIDGAQNEFAAASQRALDKANRAPNTNPFRPAPPGDRDGAAADMEGAATQYHVQKSRIAASAGKLVGPASTLDIRNSALWTSRAALGVATTGGVATLITNAVNAHINAQRLHGGS